MMHFPEMNQHWGHCLGPKQFFDRQQWNGIIPNLWRTRRSCRFSRRLESPESAMANTGILLWPFGFGRLAQKTFG